MYKLHVKLINFIIFNHTTSGYEAILAIPHVFPVFILMYPFSPQPVPHEFFTIQNVLENPTAKTPWSKEVLQLLKIPDS